MLINLYSHFAQRFIFTNGDFNHPDRNQNYIFAQVPYHRARRNLIKLILGEIPEWRGSYSSKWLDKNLTENFDIIISFIYSPCALLFGTWISQKKKCKHMIHIADHCDFFLQPKYMEAIKTADSLVVISNRMKALYEKHSQRKDIKVFHNVPDDRCFPVLDSIDDSRVFSQIDPLKVVFIGGLYEYLHKSSIEDIISSIAALHAKGIPIEMDIYGTRYPKGFLDSEVEKKGITHHGMVMPLETKYKIMENADAFVIPSSFDPTLNTDYQYSFPSKLTELLSTAKPVLYYGPCDTSIHEFLKEIGSSITVTNRSVKLLHETLINLIDNYTARKLDAVKISRKIRKKYDMETTLHKFGTHLTQVAS
jgi:glycosyltransferase involved in cell wall biosynthesis